MIDDDELLTQSALGKLEIYKVECWEWYAKSKSNGLCIENICQNVENYEHMEEF